MNNPNLVTCPICRKALKKINNSHLKKHNLTVNQFKKLYPNSGLMSENTRLLHIISSQKEKRINKYLENPKLCKQCNKIIDYNKKMNKFCNHSCAASHINKKRGPVSEQTKENIRKGVMKKFGYDEKIKTKRTCPTCKKMFEVKLSPYKIDNSLGKKYCCNSCAGKMNVKIMHKHTKKNRIIISEKLSKTRKQMFKDGKLDVTGGRTKWYDYKDFKVQGSYELRMCHILDYMKTNNLIEGWEYTKDRFGYTGPDGEHHTYILDFKVYNKEKFYYIETKGYSTETDYCKWEAVRNKGYDLFVYYNEDIFKLEEKYNLI